MKFMLNKDLIKTYSDTPAYTQFTEDYCWALNTYALHDIGESNEVFDTDERLITYYQWAPLILLLSIILILIPNCLWKGFAPSYRKFPEIARNFSLSLNSEQQNQLVKKATRIVEDVIIHTTKPAELSYIYLGIKCTIIIVLLMEIMLYRTILGPKHFFNIFVPGSRGTTLNERFPLVTQCFVTVYVSRDNGVNEVPAQCALPNNIILYHVFIFCSFWFIFLLLVSLYGLIYWMVSLLSYRMRLRYIRSKIHIKANESDLHAFVDALGVDGVFLIKMTSKNGSDLFASLLTHNLFKIFLKTKLDLPNH